MTSARTAQSMDPGEDALANGDRAGIQSYLRRRHWLEATEAVEGVERAGPGNMNLVIRVTTGRRSVIVKHGRPFVERYPDIAAPDSRTDVEAQWYGLVGNVPRLAARLPELIGVDRADHVLVLSDLGKAGDFTGAYAGERIDDPTLDALVGWLADLHVTFRDADRARRIENHDMRRLNHEHIFEVPFRPGDRDGLDAITPGLSQLAVRIRADWPLRAAMAELGAAYLGCGTTLLHGDYYPGSWLKGPDGPCVIDPEFGFFGLAEFDVGVMIAHLALSGHSQDVAERMLGVYAVAAPLDRDLASAFAGAEVIRRLLGVAQLPLRASLEEKAVLLDAAVANVRAGVG